MLTSLKMECACSRTLLKDEDAVRVCMEMVSAYIIKDGDGMSIIEYH